MGNWTFLSVVLHLIQLSSFWGPIYNLAFLFFNTGIDFIVEYEKYGSGKTRAPDFTINFSGKFKFNVEVTRIHEIEKSRNYDNFIDYISDEIKKLPSNFSVSVDLLSNNLNDSFIDKLNNSRDLVIKFIKEKIEFEKNSIDLGEEESFLIHISELKNNLQLSLSRPLKKLSNMTSFVPGSMPVFYTNKEHKKIGDLIFNKLGQMIPGMSNILFIFAENTTFEKEDIHSAVASINRLISKKEENFFKNKKYTGISDFLNHTKNLSGISFRSVFHDLNSKIRNNYWPNSQAKHPIPSDLVKIMENLK